MYCFRYYFSQAKLEVMKALERIQHTEDQVFWGDIMFRRYLQRILTQPVRFNGPVLELIAPAEHEVFGRVFPGRLTSCPVIFGNRLPTCPAQLRQLDNNAPENPFSDLLKVTDVQCDINTPELL